MPRPFLPLLFFIWIGVAVVVVMVMGMSRRPSAATFSALFFVDLSTSIPHFESCVTVTFLLFPPLPTRFLLLLRYPLLSLSHLLDAKASINGSVQSKNHKENVVRFPVPFLHGKELVAHIAPTLAPKSNPIPLSVP